MYRMNTFLNRWYRINGRIQISSFNIGNSSPQSTIRSLYGCILAPIAPKYPLIPFYCISQFTMKYFHLFPFSKDRKHFEPSLQRNVQGGFFIEIASLTDSKLSLYQQSFFLQFFGCSLKLVLDVPFFLSYNPVSKSYHSFLQSDFWFILK